MPSSIERTFPTGHPIEVALIQHRLNKEQFAGKTVANLGSGYSDYEGDLARLGIQATVLNVEGNEDQLDRLRRKNPSARILQADIGSPLQIPDESMDIVLASYSYPLWARSGERIKTFYHESMRILSAGGLLSVYPHEPRPLLEEDYQHSPIWLDRLGACQDIRRELEMSPEWDVADTPPELLQATKID